MEQAPQFTRVEFDRFVVLFDRLAQATDEWIERTPNDKLDWVPVDNPNVRFGDRISLVTIKSIYIHVAVEEYHRMRFLKDCEEGATVPIPKDPALAARLAKVPSSARPQGYMRTQLEPCDRSPTSSCRKPSAFPIASGR